MIREDRELLAELARLNTDVAPLVLRVMEGSASAVEQHSYAQRLIAAGQRLQQRANQTGWVVDGETGTDGCTVVLEADDPVVHRGR